MAKPLHEQMLDEGAQQAPEPETAEQRSARGRRVGAAAGGVAAGGAALAKLGILGKVLIGVAGWHAFVSVISRGGWYVAAGVALVLAVTVALIARRES